MAFFPRPVRPSRAIGDLWMFIRQRRRHELGFGLLAVGITCLWFWAIFDKLDVRPEWQPPKVMYVKQWPLTRTEAEVRAQLAKDAPKELAERKAAEEAARKRQDEYKKLAKTLGIDVTPRR
jgi:hypothetical protein